MNENHNPLEALIIYGNIFELFEKLGEHIPIHDENVKDSFLKIGTSLEIFCKRMVEYYSKNK